MRLLLFVILAGYTVRCDDASYYVIEMPEETQREYSKPFRVYWNVPTMQCRSKRIPFADLFDKFGIIQNSGDSFRGEKVSILYDPGLFPALLKNETSGRFKFRNGGVPQEGDLEKHLVAFRSALEQSVPDEEFSGIGIIDFESWRPVFRQNFGVLVPYKDISYQIERKLHWFWTERAIQARARQRFEEAARAFMQTSLSVAKQMRPRGLWGYYGFPYCFNMASNNMVESCSDKVKQENDKTYWLWSESTALYPSIYSSKSLSSSQLAALVRGRVAEAAREARRGTPVLPYFWFRYRDGGFLSQTDLDIVLETLYKSNASGFIIWGSSNDVNTVEKCNSLLKYIDEVMGPAIAKYTKGQYPKNTTDTTTSNPVSNFGLTTWRPILRDHQHNSTTTKPTFDPEYHWEPPENYSQDIVHYVNQELKKKPGYNATDNNETVNVGIKKLSLIEMLLNIFRNDDEHNDTNVNEVIISTKDEIKSQNENRTTTIALSTKTYTEYSTESNSPITPNIITRNPLLTLMKDQKKGTPDNKYTETLLIHETSTYKPNHIISSTISYTTKSYISITEKNDESPDNKPDDPVRFQNSDTTDLNKKSEHEDEILAEILSTNNISLITTDSKEILTTTAEPNNITYDEESLYDLTENNTISFETEDRSTVIPELYTYENNADNVTEFNVSEDSYIMTNTSQEDSDVPADENNTLRTHASTNTPHFTLKFTNQKQEKPSKNDKKGHARLNIISNENTSEQNSISTNTETTEEGLTQETIPTTSDYGDLIYEDSDILSIDNKETEEYILLRVNKTKSDAIHNVKGNGPKNRKKGLVLSRENQSTNTGSVITNSVEDLSTTENLKVIHSDVPDIENEGYRIAETSDSGETTTDAHEVVVFL